MSYIIGFYYYRTTETLVGALDTTNKKLVFFPISFTMQHFLIYLGKF